MAQLINTSKGSEASYAISCRLSLHCLYDEDVHVNLMPVAGLPGSGFQMIIKEMSVSRDLFSTVSDSE